MSITTRKIKELTCDLCGRPYDDSFGTMPAEQIRVWAKVDGWGRKTLVRNKWQNRRRTCDLCPICIETET